MIDVHIQPFGRTLMTMAIGAMKYQAVVQQKNIDNLKKGLQNIQDLETNRNIFNDISLDITTRLIDKRFSESKEFVRTGGASASFKFKKSTSESDKHLQYVTQKQMIQSRSRFNAAVSQHNKGITDMKIKKSFKLINLKPVFK